MSFPARFHNGALEIQLRPPEGHVWKCLSSLDFVASHFDAAHAGRMEVYAHTVKWHGAALPALTDASQLFQLALEGPA
eukprot:4697839-Alexandrium_andersonii.AAC.1